MLRVRIDSREVEVTPAALAQMMLDGQVGRHHLAKGGDGAAERPLEFALDPSHYEALAGELLRRLRSMYSAELTACDIENVRDRVEALCQWHCSEPDVRARLLWVAAWLNELTGRAEAALGHYDAFLRGRCREAHLRLLAFNNRGVLRLQQGRSEGVLDLARAAIIPEQGAAEPARSAGLPVACFNLLNLINVAAQTMSLSEAVDEELGGFFAQLPEEVASWWLGFEATEELGAAALPGRNGKAEAPKAWAILRDVSTRRLNRLATNLATRALKMTESVIVEEPGHPQPTLCRLSLWPGEGDSVPQEKNRNYERYAGDAYDRYADAGSLLLGEDIPCALAANKGPDARVEQLAQEELAAIEDLIVNAHYDLARSRLEIQRRVVTALNQRRRFVHLLGYIDEQLQRIDRATQQYAQLEFQQACGNLVAETEQFCKVTHPAEAERRLASLKRKLESYRAEAPDEMAALLDELGRRMDQHMKELRQADVRNRVRPRLEALHEHWPTDWAVPVPDSAYAILAECHVNDPEGAVEDWAALKDQLDAHQAQYCLQKALAELPGERVSWKEIEAVLVDALRLSPDLWLTVAPLFGLLGWGSQQRDSKAGPGVRTALESAAGRLLQGSASSNGADRSRSLLHRADELLKKAFGALQADTRRFVRLWDCLEITLTPVLAGGGEDVISEVEALAKTCLDHWPTGRTDGPGRSDPRNPVRIFLESCEKARHLALAERLLGEQPPALQDAKGHIAEALRLGLETPEQFKRAAAAIYLSEYSQQDAAALQRGVLTRLDAWVEGMTANLEQLRGQERIMQELAAIRADVGGDPSMGGAEGTNAAETPEV